MKTKQIIGIILLTLIIWDCSKEREYKNIIGEWGGWDEQDGEEGWEHELSFSLQDTCFLGILNKSIDRRYYENSNDYEGYTTTYEKGSVLFKDLKKLTDTTYYAKGLVIKPIFTKYRVKKPTLFNWGGDDGHGNIYVEEKSFDHFESSYMDYRIVTATVVGKEAYPINKVICLYITPYSDGLHWEFMRAISKQDEQKVRIYSDSIRVSDSLAEIKAELEREVERKKADNKRRTERARELLK
jgi:hypothetical protein